MKKVLIFTTIFTTLVTLIISLASNGIDEFDEDHDGPSSFQGVEDVG